MEKEIRNKSNSHSPKIITCTGYGGTGSSAATDFFSEFDNVFLVTHTFECTFIHEADGLYDLEKAVEEGHRFKVDNAVCRFLKLCEWLQKREYHAFFNGRFLELTKEFIGEAFDCKWNGWWHRSNEISPMKLKRRLLHERAKLHYRHLQKKKKYELYEADTWRPNYQPHTTQYYSNDIEKFRTAAKKYVAKLISELNYGNADFVLIDQLLPPIKPELYLHFFDDIKVVVVDKDPRDHFLANKLFWGERYIPYDVDKYIDFYSQTRKNKTDSENVKFINFEDLLYRYERTTEELMEFTGLKPSQHTKKGKFLIPEQSKRNTMIFLRYSNFADEISKIESSLSKYLFDFSGNKDFEKKSKSEKEYYKSPVVNDISECDKIVEQGFFNPIFIPILALKFVIGKIRRFYHG